MKLRAHAYATAFALAALLLLAPRALAEQPGGAAGIPAGEIPDVLRARVGKSVTLQLRSGKELGGIVGEVRGETVVLRNLTGKELFDALVRLDDVSAIEIRR